MRLALTCGEPAGIGPEISLKAAVHPLPTAIIAIGDSDLLRQRATQFGIAVDVIDVSADNLPTSHNPGQLPVLSQAFPEPDCLGKPRIANAQALLDGLDRAVDGCRRQHFAAMVTAPLQKSIIADAGFAFSGHTEYLAARCDVTKPVMLLANRSLRVALATTHLPLRAVPDAITATNLDHTLDVLHDDLCDKFALAKPSIAVCGLNPHAGEGGHLGHEDDAVIQPAITRQRQRGRNVHGPYPADTIFNHAGKTADAILAMYHDQGLPVIKFAGFGDIVNITLGLPIIRTSVDHGSALDIAAHGTASETSLIEAIQQAAALAGCTNAQKR
ncbi:MAG: 4-hydroxythreonine-4-phosphate dehydrogenase PdxA [Pseudomonadota bacterium]